MAIDGPIVLSLLKEALVWPCGPAHDASIVHFEARFIWTQALFQHLSCTRNLHQGMPSGHISWAYGIWSRISWDMMGYGAQQTAPPSGFTPNVWLFEWGKWWSTIKVEVPCDQPTCLCLHESWGGKGLSPLQDHEIQGAFTTSWSFTHGVYSNHPQSIRSSLLKGFHRSFQSWVHPYLNWPWSSLNINQYIPQPPENIN